ncbi:hypothetical protein BCY89_18875 [Sphingobacterium siyangense]|uniref:Lmo0937 family membrane protein n=1 Tax=Sphingobacterium siyangense TaxID=459529 RepID=A0A420FDM5_9SPHI|nr:MULTISPECIES: lmo0937 family membrane protein [Sphingobacterium]QQT29498.1 lmo0937 family membrane protein [Sphingobacterium multivorum]RKF30986.1 hypothetical protein BCY89_18875 [Sphingobacterium siyangense]
MEDLLYSVAISVMIVWAVTFVGGFITEDFIHILLIIAAIAFIFRAIKAISNSKVHQPQQ